MNCSETYAHSVPTDARGWPTIIADDHDAQAWLTDRVAALLAEAGPLPLWLIADQIFRDPHLPAILRDSAAIDTRLAITDRALRHAQADRVWTLDTHRSLKFDLDAHPEDLPAAIARAARLGMTDERAGHRDRRGVDIARYVCETWRVGHERAFRSAYSVGRQHVAREVA